MLNLLNTSKFLKLNQPILPTDRRMNQVTNLKNPKNKKLIY